MNTCEEMEIVLFKVLQGKSASSSLCTVPLWEFPQAARSLLHRSAMTAWETRAGKEEGEKTGEESVTKLLSRSAICPSLSTASGSS